MTVTDATTAAADRILDRYRVFAMMGASPDPRRASHGVMGVLHRHGYTVIPVNPHATDVRGVPSYPSLEAVPGPVDVVDIFRRSEAAGGHVDEAIAIGAKAVWMQLGVIDEAAAERARAAGVEVVMDRCPAIELSRRATWRESA
jgi:predicted CoA-binding protein